MAEKSELEKALGNLVKFCGPVVQTKVMRKIAGYMSKVNKRRDKLNVQPDGSAMVARKRPHSRPKTPELMVYAWSIAKSMAQEKGGTPKSHMAEAIKKAAERNGKGSQKMFVKWSKGKANRVFVQRYDERQASVEFYGKAQRILQDNQLGRAPNSFQPPLPVRELIGLTENNQQEIVKIIQEDMDFFISTGKLKSVRGN